MGTEQTAVVSFSSSPEQNNREAMFDITFKEVDKLTRQAETRAHQLGPSWARQSPVALDFGQARVGDLILTIQLHYNYNGRSCNDMHMKHHHFPCEALN